MKPIPRSAAVLTISVLSGAALASAATLLWNAPFPAPPSGPVHNTVLAEAQGWSVVTLVVAVPLTALAFVAAWRGSKRGRLGWIGALAYFVYTFLELAVSGPFTALYLVYIATFATAIPALVILVSTLGPAPDAQPHDTVLRRTIATFSLIVAAGLALAWLRPITQRTLANDFGWPDAIGSVAHVVHALDLGLIVPLALATAMLLIRRRPAGETAAAMMLVLSVLMGAALAAMVTSSALTTGQSVSAALPFFALAGVAAVLAIAFFRGVKPS